MSRLLVLLMCTVLAACGTNRPNPLIVPSPFQVAQPFQGAERNDELLAAITETASVVVSPVEGLSETLNQSLIEDVTEAAQRRDIPLSTNTGTRSADRLTGRFEAWVDRMQRLNGTVIWRLENTNGELIDMFEAGAPMYPNAGSGGTLTPGGEQAWREAIADETAILLGDALDARPMAARLYQDETERETASGPPVMIPAISGAPGDGNLSLTRAVRSLLEQQGVAVIDPNLPPDGFVPERAYTLRGAVGMGAPMPEGAQPIAITWDLYSPTGAHLGNVAQQNMIQAGSLDGPWGEVAIYAAMGATEGILTLLSTIPDEGS